MIDSWPLYCMGAFQSPTPNRSGPTMVRSPKSRLKAWTLASIAQTIQNKFRKKHHDTHATVIRIITTEYYKHTLESYTGLSMLFSILSRRCITLWKDMRDHLDITELFAHLTSDPFEALNAKKKLCVQKHQQCWCRLAKTEPRCNKDGQQRPRNRDKPW